MVCPTCSRLREELDVLQARYDNLTEAVGSGHDYWMINRLGIRSSTRRKILAMLIKHGRCHRDLLEAVVWGDEVRTQVNLRSHVSLLRGDLSISGMTVHNDGNGQGVKAEYYLDRETLNALRAMEGNHGNTSEVPGAH